MKNGSGNALARVSLVIPAYNEEAHLVACLDSVAAQSVRPFEVIVVDNNSTDFTAAIARSYPFVRLIRERRQGVMYARDRGFTAARGDVIARIDGDTILTPQWIQTIQQLFADPTIDAASGVVHYRDVGLSGAFDDVDVRVRRYLASRMERKGEHFLYGVNMALRKNAWQSVRKHVCHEQSFHEDQDLAIHLRLMHKRIIFTETMRVSISPRQAASGLRDFLRYVWSNSWVYEAHGQQSARYINRVAFGISCLYLPIHLMYKGYNPTTGRFSIMYAINGSTAARISPVSEIA